MEVKSHVSRSVAIHQYKKSLTASAVLLMQKSLGIIGGLHVDSHISSFDRECAKNVILYIRTHISIKCLLKSYSLHTGTPPPPPNDHNHKFMHYDKIMFDPTTCITIIFYRSLSVVQPFRVKWFLYSPVVICIHSWLPNILMIWWKLLTLC